jgi:hypothetical protein
MERSKVELQGVYVDKYTNHVLMQMCTYTFAVSTDTMLTF